MARSGNRAGKLQGAAARVQYTVGRTCISPQLTMKPPLLLMATAVLGIATEGCNGAIAAPARPDAGATPDADWTWVRSRFAVFPKDVLPAAAVPVAMEALLAWVPPDHEGILFDRACRPIHVHRDLYGREPVLVGEVHVQVSHEGIRRERRSNQVMFWDAIFAYSSGPYGWFQPIGGRLSRVTEDAAFWNDAWMSIGPDCARRIAEQRACDGGVVRCERCAEWRFVPKSVDGWTGTDLEFLNSFRLFSSRSSRIQEFKIRPCYLFVANSRIQDPSPRFSATAFIVASWPSAAGDDPERGRVSRALATHFLVPGAGESGASFPQPPAPGSQLIRSCDSNSLRGFPPLIGAAASSHPAAAA